MNKTASGEITAQVVPSIDPRKRDINSRRTTALMSSLYRHALSKGATQSGGMEASNEVNVMCFGLAAEDCMARIDQFGRPGVNGHA